MLGRLVCGLKKKERRKIKTSKSFVQFFLFKIVHFHKPRLTVSHSPNEPETSTWNSSLVKSFSSLLFLSLQRKSHHQTVKTSWNLIYFKSCVGTNTNSIEKRWSQNKFGLTRNSQQGKELPRKCWFTTKSLKRWLFHFHMFEINSSSPLKEYLRLSVWKKK